MKFGLISLAALAVFAVGEQVGEFLMHKRILKKMNEAVESGELQTAALQVAKDWDDNPNDTRTMAQVAKDFYKSNM